MTNVYIWMSISSHTEAIGHQPTIDAQIAPWAVGSEWDELHLSWKKTLLPHDVIWNGELFGQWKSAVLILFPTSTSLRKLNQPLLCTTLLRNNKKHWCVINIFFLLKPKHSIITDATKKKKTTQSLVELHTDKSVFTARVVCSQEQNPAFAIVILCVVMVKGNCSRDIAEISSWCLIWCYLLALGGKQC